LKTVEAWGKRGYPGTSNTWERTGTKDG